MRYQYKQINSKCPLCQNSNGKLLYEITSEKAACYLVPRGNPNKINKLKLHLEALWRRKSCKKIICSSCNLTYWNPFKGGDEKFYSEVYSSSNKYPDWRWEYGLTINTIKKMALKDDSSIMEIGAGKGAFMKKLSFKLIAKNRRYSNEISKNGIKELKHIGIVNYRDLSKVKKCFSIICMFDSIEHIDSLNDLFKNISNISQKGSSLFISTHMPETVRFVEQNNISLDLSPTHVSCWDKKSFEFLCKKFKFKLIKRKLLKQNFHQRIITFGFGKFEYNKMQDKSLEFKINSIKRKKVRKLFIYLYLIILAPYAIYNAIKKKNIYSGQWVYLQKL